MHVSPKYLRKLAGPLEKAGLIKSVQGIYGGYALNKKPEEITLQMLMDAFNERVSLADCLLGKKCELEGLLPGQASMGNAGKNPGKTFFADLSPRYSRQQGGKALILSGCSQGLVSGPGRIDNSAEILYIQIKER